MRTRSGGIGRARPQFHAFFEAQYEKLDDFVDDVAERARALGHPAAGSLAEFTKLARVPEQPGTSLDADAMIRQLLTDHEAVVRRLRADAVSVVETHHDLGTSDFLTGLLEEHEKMAWMLRASLLLAPQHVPLAPDAPS